MEYDSSLFVHPSNLPPITINQSTNATGTPKDLMTKEGLIVTFYPVIIEDDIAEKVDKLGEVTTKKIRRSSTFIKIRAAGQQLNIVEREVTEQDKVRFKDLWQAYNEKKLVQEDGTPLRGWKDIPGPLCRLLEQNEIYTIEQFVEVSDTGCMNMGGDLLAYKYKAQEWLTGQKAELGAAYGKIKEMEEKINMLMERNSGLDDLPPKKMHHKTAEKLRKLQEQSTSDTA